MLLVFVFISCLVEPLVHHVFFRALVFRLFCDSFSHSISFALLGEHACQCHIVYHSLGFLPYSCRISFRDQ